MVIAVRAVAVRHVPLNRTANTRQRVWQIVRRERGAHSHHPATDVHAHGRRDNGALGRDHRTHSRADAVVNVRHYRDVRVDERQHCDVAQLVLRFVLNWNALDPGLDRRVRAFDFFITGHDRFSFSNNVFHQARQRIAIEALHLFQRAVFQRCVKHRFDLPGALIV